jgi:hypothetical protein
MLGRVVLLPSELEPEAQRTANALLDPGFRPMDSADHSGDAGLLPELLLPTCDQVLVSGAIHV